MDRLSGIPHLSVMRDCIIFVTTGVWESGNDAYDVMNFFIFFSLYPLCTPVFSSSFLFQIRAGICLMLCAAQLDESYVVSSGLENVR